MELKLTKQGYWVNGIKISWDITDENIVVLPGVAKEISTVFVSDETFFFVKFSYENEHRFARN